MPDARHNRHRHCPQFSGQCFGVKAPEVRQRAAPAYKKQNVNFVSFASFFERSKDFAFRSFTLNTGVINHKGHPRSQARTRLHNILKRSRFGACDHPHGLRIARQFLFKRCVKKAFGQKLSLESLEFGKQSAVAGGLYGNDVELQLSAHLKDVERTGEHHSFSLLGQSFQSIGVATPDHAVQNRVVFVVLEIKIDVSGRIGLDRMDFAFDTNQPQTIEPALDAAQNARDADGRRQCESTVLVLGHCALRICGTPTATVQGSTSKEVINPAW